MSVDHSPMVAYHREMHARLFLHPCPIQCKKMVARGSQLISLLGSFVCLQLFAAQSLAQVSNIVPQDRIYEWSGNVGVPGDIPHLPFDPANCSAATRCVDVSKPPYSADLTGGVDASAAINAAIMDVPSKCPIAESINSCAEIWTVYLPSGTYRLEDSIRFNSSTRDKSGIVLRGAGPENTILLGKHRVSKPAMITAGAGGMSQEKLLAGGYGKGSTTVTVDNATGLSPGRLINFFQSNDPAVVWDRWGGLDKIRHMAIVTAVDGNQVSFKPPLPYSFSAALRPRWRYHQYGTSRFVGVEDLTIDASGNQYDPADAKKQITGSQIAFTDVYAGWIRNVHSKFADNAHFLVDESLRISIEGNYISDTTSANDGYGMLIRKDTSGILVSNNIFKNGFSFIVLEGTDSSVVAYNYVADCQSNSWPHQTPAYNSNHGSHGIMTLWEGNVGQQFQNDGYHGSTSHHTLLRNLFHGKHSKYSTNRKMIDLTRFSYFHNLVGNILGDPSWTNSVTKYEVEDQGYSYSQPAIYRFGYPSMGNNGYTGTYPSGPLSGCGTSIATSTYKCVTNVGACTETEPCCPRDLCVKPTLLRYRNFDYMSGQTLSDDSFANKGLALPSSLYLTGKPTWWGNLRWPPIGPDLAPMVCPIPAEVRFHPGLTVPSECLTTAGSSPSAPRNLRVASEQ